MNVFIQHFILEIKYFYEHHTQSVTKSTKLINFRIKFSSVDFIKFTFLLCYPKFQATSFFVTIASQHSPSFVLSPVFFPVFALEFVFYIKNGNNSESIFF